MNTLETRIITRLLNNRKLLMGVIIGLQCSIYVSLLLPLWIVRTKENIRGSLIGYNRGKKELTIGITERDKHVFRNGRPLELMMDRFSVTGMVKHFSSVGSNNLLTVKIDKNESRNIPNSGAVQIITRGKRILEIFLQQWKNKTNNS